MVKIDSETKENQTYLEKKLKNGYHGYIKQGDRKKSEKVFRKVLKAELATCLDNLKIIQEAALMSQMITTWSDLDRLIASFSDLVLVINSSKYGISTFFESNIIKDFNLNLLYKLERMIIEIIEKLGEKISSFNDSIESGMLSDSSRVTHEILADLAAITNAWKERVRLVSDFQKLGLV